MGRRFERLRYAFSGAVSKIEAYQTGVVALHQIPVYSTIRGWRMEKECNPDGPSYFDAAIFLLGDVSSAAAIPIAVITANPRLILLYEGMRGLLGLHELAMRDKYRRVGEARRKGEKVDEPAPA